MAQEGPSFLHLLLLHIFIHTTLTSSLIPPSTTTTITSTASPPSPLDQEQLKALQSLKVIPISKEEDDDDPCSRPHKTTTTCDSSTPFRHLLSLKLINCSDDAIALSPAPLKSLSTLKDLYFINCHIPPIRFPTQLASSLRSFTCINSLRKLTGVWLSRFRNLTDLTVSNVVVHASGPSIILNSIINLRSVTISHASLTGHLPRRWNLNLTSIDLSANHLHGKIPDSLTRLENLIKLNLSFNSLRGEIPDRLGDLISLQNASLASNSLSGSVPDSLSAIPGLVHLDLGSNQLNGTIPGFLSDMKNLNLENNNFHGVLPFNSSFIKRLLVFKVGGNSNLCYNISTLSTKAKLGIAPCGQHGVSLPPPSGKYDGSGDGLRSDDDHSDNDDEEEGGSKPDHHRGPNKVVLGVAIALASVVFLIVFLVLLSKCGN